MWESPILLASSTGTLNKIRELQNRGHSAHLRGHWAVLWATGYYLLSESWLWLALDINIS